MKGIYDYFEDALTGIDLNKKILRFNTVHVDVSTTFLDTFVNNVDEHLISYTLDYYHQYPKKKYSLIDKGNSEVNTKISDIEDDVVIASKIERGYIFFWYHMSGRCDIGRFETDDNIEDVKNCLINWMNFMVKEEVISGYYEMQLCYLKGNIKF